MREGRSGNNSSQRVPNQTNTFNHEYRCEEIILDFHCDNFAHLFDAIVRAWEHSFDPEHIYLAIILEEESWSLFKIILVALESMDEDNETDTLRGCELSPCISGWEIVKNEIWMIVIFFKNNLLLLHKFVSISFKLLDTFISDL